MLNTKTKFVTFFGLTFAISITGLFFNSISTLATEYTLDNVESMETWQINQDINEKRSEIQELKRQVEVYEKNIAAKQRELTTLSVQVSTLNESIAKINLEIDAAELEMETINQNRKH